MNRLELTFTAPVHGYWDGGAKSSGIFEVQPVIMRLPANKIKWGCFELNFWFICKRGKTDADSVQIASRYLRRTCKRKCSIKVIE